MTGRDPNEVLSPKQAAVEVGVSYQTLMKHIHDGELRAVKRGRRYYIRRAWLDEYMPPADTPWSA